MLTNREKLSAALNAVLAGTSPKEVVEQSDCFVFTGGEVLTFNDEVACRAASPLPELEGAVPARKFLDLLARLPDEEIDVTQADGELLIRAAKSKNKAGVRMEAEIMLPVDAVERPGKWAKLPPEFADAVRTTAACAGKDESQFALTCLHMTPEFVEACDNFQLARFPLALPISGGVLVRAAGIRAAAAMGMTGISESDQWLHLKNDDGLTLSCRRFLEDYADVSAHLSDEGCVPATLPGGVEESVALAKIFSGDDPLSENITVKLKPGRMLVEGRSTSGWYQGAMKVAYDGAEVSFMVSPDLLVEICRRSRDCKIGEGRLVVDVGKFRYVTCTHVPQ